MGISSGGSPSYYWVAKLGQTGSSPDTWCIPGIYASCEIHNILPWFSIWDMFHAYFQCNRVLFYDEGDLGGLPFFRWSKWISAGRTSHLYTWWPCSWEVKQCLDMKVEMSWEIKGTPGKMTSISAAAGRGVASWEVIAILAGWHLFHNVPAG